jgi:GT2 family glycosyltransferase
MNKIVFVILHYCTLQDTIECVNSIKHRIDTANYEILIVDNCSPNGSVNQLLKLYKEENKITILQNKENLGFARGNNIGFRHAKNECKSDFIVLLNNDTMLISDNFFNIILKEYDNNRFAVMGPHIITPQEPYNSNPGQDAVMTLAQLNKHICIVRIRLYFNYLYIDNIYDKFLKKIKNFTKNSITNVDRTKLRCENVQLHGCCLIFSPLYIEQFDGLDERTFLYREEDILYTQIMKRGLKTVYNPAIEIYHKESKSTEFIEKETLKKRRFKYKNLLRSNKVLKDVILKNTRTT